MKEVDAGISVIALTIGFSAFTHFLPKLHEIRKYDCDDETHTADVRLGEVAAAGVTIGTGAVVSSLTKSNIPILVSVVVTAGFVLLYEYALRTDRALEKGKTHGK